MSKEGPSEDKAKLSHSTAHTPESISSLEATVMLPKKPYLLCRGFSKSDRSRPLA